MKKHKNKIYSSIVIGLLLSSSAVYAQETVTGSISISCPTPTIGIPQLSINDDLTSPAQLRFQNVTYGSPSTATPIETAGQLKITVSDDRGYPGCGTGFDIRVTADPTSQYFDSQSLVNDNIIFVGNSANENLEIQGSDWDTTPEDVALITAGPGSIGVDETNIIGQPTNSFSWTGSNFNTITLVQAQQAFEGSFDILYEGDDINLDVPANAPIDIYYKSLTIDIVPL